MRYAHNLNGYAWKVREFCQIVLYSDCETSTIDVESEVEREVEEWDNMHKGRVVAVLQVGKRRRRKLDLKSYSEFNAVIILLL